jgi:hypothetical protein
VPVVAASWLLFVKSAAAALGVVVGSASLASYTGLLKLPTERSVAAPTAKPHAMVPSARASAPLVAVVEPALPEPEPEPEPQLNPVPALPTVPTSAASGSSLAIESLLLEQARREMRSSPAAALQIATEHAQRFPRAQLSAERMLIEIEALHRLGREAEARALAQRMLSGSSKGLYAERVRQLLGSGALP